MTVSPAALADALEVLRLLSTGSWTRSELARATSLSRSTIGLRLDALRSAGLVADAGQEAPEGGRPASRVGLNRRARVVAAVELGHSECKVTLADLGSTPISDLVTPIAVDDDHDRVLDGVREALTRLVQDLPGSYGALASITVGLPMSATLGAVGLVGGGRAPGWGEFPIQRRLERDFGVPVFVENDVNLQTLGEQISEHPQVADLMLVHVGAGIGAGVVAGGTLVRGAHALAGEIAHVPVVRGADDLCLCGNLGCLGAVATLPAVIRRVGGGSGDLPALLERVRAGDFDAASALRQAGRDIGDVLVYLISATNPEILVVGGALAFAGEHLLAGVKEVLYAKGAPALTGRLHVLRAATSDGFGTRGALRLATEHTLAEPNLAHLLAAASGSPVDEDPGALPAAQG